MRKGHAFILFVSITLLLAVNITHALSIDDFFRWFKILNFPLTGFALLTESTGCCQYYSPTTSCDTMTSAICANEGGVFYSTRVCCLDGYCRASCGATTTTTILPPACNDIDCNIANTVPCQCGSAVCTSGNAYCCSYYNACGSSTSDCDAKCVAPSTTTTTSTTSTTTTTTIPTCSNTNCNAVNTQKCKCGSTTCSAGYYCCALNNKCAGTSSGCTPCATSTTSTSSTTTTTTVPPPTTTTSTTIPACSPSDCSSAVTNTCKCGTGTCSYSQYCCAATSTCAISRTGCGACSSTTTTSSTISSSTTTTYPSTTTTSSTTTTIFPCSQQGTSTACYTIGCNWCNGICQSSLCPTTTTSSSTSTTTSSSTTTTQPSSTTLTTEVTTSSSSKPNLVVDSIEPVSQSLVINTPLEFRITFANKGDATIDKMWTISMGIGIKATLISWTCADLNFYLQPNEKTSCIIKLKYDFPGDYSIKNVAVDTTNSIDESNENDNTLSYSFYVYSSQPFCPSDYTCIDGAQGCDFLCKNSLVEEGYDVTNPCNNYGDNYCCKCVDTACSDENSPCITSCFSWGQKSFISTELATAGYWKLELSSARTVTIQDNPASGLDSILIVKGSAGKILCENNSFQEGQSENCVLNDLPKGTYLIIIKSKKGSGYDYPSITNCESKCTGTIYLYFYPQSPVLPLSLIRATFCGLIGETCAGKTAYLMVSQTSSACSCQISKYGCCECYFLSPKESGVYTYTAAIDKDDDNHFGSPGELSSQTLEVSNECVKSPLQLFLGPNNDVGLAKETLTYWVSIANKDTLACSGTEFELTINIPDGWSYSILTTDFVLNPQKFANLELNITSSENAELGSYTIGVTAKRKDTGETTTASSIYEVVKEKIGTCADSDGDDPETPGYVEGQYGTRSFHYNDYCGIGGINSVTEYTCRDNTMSSESYDCNVFCGNKYGSDYAGLCAMDGNYLGYCKCSKKTATDVCQKIHYSGDPSTKLDVVIVGNKIGTELTDFSSKSSSIAGAILSFDPFNKYSDKINFYRVNLDEDFECDYSGICAVCNQQKILEAANNCPLDQIIFIYSAQSTGGCAIPGFATANARWDSYNLVAVHEFGHSFGRLMDEYVYWDIDKPREALPGETPWGPNCDVDSKCSRWNGAGEGCTSSNPEQPGCTKGCSATNWYSPGCLPNIMACSYTSGTKFDPVCKNRLINLLSRYS